MKVLLLSWLPVMVAWATNAVLHILWYAHTQALTINAHRLTVQAEERNRDRDRVDQKRAACCGEHACAQGKDMQLQTIVVEVTCEAHVHTHLRTEDDTMSAAHTKSCSREEIMVAGTEVKGTSIQNMNEQSTALDGHEGVLATEGMMQHNKVGQVPIKAATLEEALRDLEHAVMETRRELYYSQRCAYHHFDCIRDIAQEKLNLFNQPCWCALLLAQDLVQLSSSQCW
jgi:hypothetical protein